MAKMTKKALFLLACFVSQPWFVIAAQAQPSNCGGFDSIQNFTAPIYPPIAKAARVQGEVILIVEFDTSGVVKSVSPISGPQMLFASALTSAKTLRVNPYSGPRTCPFVISYRIAPEGADINSFPKSNGLQHVIVTALTINTYDPSYYRRRKLFGLF